MAETVHYARRAAHFESFPAENYVDYMTNVMLIPERHIFYIPSKSLGINCSVNVSGEARILTWSAERLDEPPENAQVVEISGRRIASALGGLVEGNEPTNCPVCDKSLGQFLRFF
jgi:hypothetical protein